MMFMSRTLFSIIFLGMVVFVSADTRAAPVLRVAAAADLACCIEAINSAFEKAADAKVQTSIGSSGNFFAQIRNGAPFDVFLSADLGYPQKLAADGFAERTTLIVYAIGSLSLMASDRRFSSSLNWKTLTDPAVTRIAIANPDVAPYGRAAKEALTSAGLWERLQDKLVRGENVAQTAQFVRSGNAQIGLVGTSHVEAGQPAWPVPHEMHAPIEQGGIVTAHGKGHPLARQYLAFLHSETARRVLRPYGFRFPAASE